jgi:phospholipid/cholesterol/gamma-HCH transport system substrate-binding protein
MEYQIRNITALGLLVLVASALFVWGFFFLMGDPILVGGNEITVVMNDGAGLGRGDRVQLNGVQVGSVRRVTLRPPSDVTVQIKVDEGIRLPADTRALARADVFGATTIDLIPGSALVLLDGGDTIAGLVQRPLPDLASDLGGQAQTVLAAADSLLSPEAVSSLRATAAVLPEVAIQFHAAFAELSQAAASFRRTAEEMERVGTGSAAGEALAEIRGSARAATGAMQTMQVSLTSLASVLAKIDRGEGTLGRLVNDTTLYGEMSATLREMRALATDVQQNPKKYISVTVF